MNDLLLAAVFFVGTHLAISSTQLRPELISRFGETGYRVLYSLVSVCALLWFILAYKNSTYEPFWFGGSRAELLAMLLMPIAVFFVVAGNSTANPTSVGQSPDPDSSEPARGIIRVTRHPTMWGVGIWAILHIFANDDVASTLFFGAFAVLALAGAQVLDARRSRQNEPGWGVFLQSTSFVPFLAIIQGRQHFVFAEIGWMRVIGSFGVYFALLFGHQWLGGVSLIG